MSGWWFASWAAAARRFTNAIPARKSGKLERSLERAVGFVPVHPGSIARAIHPCRRAA